MECHHRVIRTIKCFLFHNVMDTYKWLSQRVRKKIATVSKIIIYNNRYNMHTNNDLRIFIYTLVNIILICSSYTVDKK